MQRHVLILGGTSDGRAIAARLAERPGLRVTTSLAGRTSSPLGITGAVRVGGFGGVAGLSDWIAQNEVALLIDATHPFAARISANARAAADQTSVKLLRFDRPAWQKQSGDNWIEVESAEAAAARLGATPRCVFLAIGRQEVAPFAAFPMHDYVVRSIEPIDDNLLPRATRILERGPFDKAAERALIETHGIEIVVAKNSGGSATYGKIAAARALGVPVVMVQRPPTPIGPSFETIDDLEVAVHQALARLAERGA